MVDVASFLRRGVIAAAVALVVTASPAGAAHRARLSADLEDHLAAGSQTVDVIVHGKRAEVDALAARYNLRVKRYLKSGAVLQVTAGQLAALQGDGDVDHLSGDVRIRASDVTAESIGADQVWAGSEDLPPLTGTGVGVAVIDSGIDFKHNALKKRVLATVDFTGGDGQDRYGHGTHVAGIIAGQAGRTAETRDYRGIAPGAFVINLRVLGDDGSGYASDVIEAIDWAIEKRKAYNIRVINLSLGTPVLQPYRDDPVCEAVERAVAAGIVVVAAAGNHGQTLDGHRLHGGITSPGNDPSVITVGALDTHRTALRSDDTVANYSSRGPTIYDLVLKPDLVSPGSRVISAEAQDSALALSHADRHIAGTGEDAYIQLSGTSMAAGVVSGAVALLLERKPKLSVRQAKTLLQISSSFMSSEGLLASGAGSLNVIAAIEAASTQSKPRLHAVLIAEETVEPSGIAFTTRVFPMHRRPLVSSTSIFWGSAKLQSVFWDTNSDSIFWGTNFNAVLRVSSAADSIFWGTSSNSILEATNTDSIFWGTADPDSIFWGSSTDSIFWGSVEDEDSIFWGTALLE